MNPKTNPLAIGMAMARRLTGLSADELAAQARVDPTVVKRMERGKTMPREQEFHRIGAVLQGTHVGQASDPNG